jgi:hypothetical protein
VGSDFFLYRLREVAEQAVWGVKTKSWGIEVEVKPSPHSRSTEDNASETCSRSSPGSYVLATLAHYEGCSIFIHPKVMA